MQLLGLMLLALIRSVCWYCKHTRCVLYPLAAPHHSISHLSLCFMLGILFSVKLYCPCSDSSPTLALFCPRRHCDTMLLSLQSLHTMLLLLHLLVLVGAAGQCWCGHWRCWLTMCCSTSSSLSLRLCQRKFHKLRAGDTHTDTHILTPTHSHPHTDERHTVTELVSYTQ